MTIHDKNNIEYIKKIITKDQIFVDVGANNGDPYTDFFYNILNNTGKIYSIELDKDNFLKIKEKYEHKNNVIILNKAVSNKDDEIPYYGGRDCYVNNIIGHYTDFQPSVQKGTIESIRLDTLLKNEPVIDMIKIDVEGAEFLVLQGLEGISDKVRNILLECHFDEDWEEIKKLLFKYNFKIINTFNNEIIDNSSSRPYQCFCTK